MATSALARGGRRPGSPGSSPGSSVLAASATSISTCWWRKGRGRRSEEDTSELHAQSNIVCRLLLEKKNQELLVMNELVLTAFQSYAAVDDSFFVTVTI